MNISMEKFPGQEVCSFSEQGFLRIFREEWRLEFVGRVGVLCRAVLNRNS